MVTKQIKINQLMQSQKTIPLNGFVLSNYQNLNNNTPLLNLDKI